MHILVVEDDARLADVLERGLVDAGHVVELRHTGPEGLAAALAAPFDAVVLDWMLPGLDGRLVCRELRVQGRGTPVLMLTARHAVADRIKGLDAGADDYLPKPFAFDELLARLRVIARRFDHQERLVVGDLIVDRDRREVMRGAIPIDVTTREFDLIALLAERAGYVVTRLHILDAVWDGETDLRSNAIDVHIANLRGKVDRPFGRKSIETIRGIGFRLADGRDD